MPLPFKLRVRARQRDDSEPSTSFANSAEAEGQKEKRKPQTRQEKEKHEKNKQIWRDRKQAERDAMTDEEREAVLAKRRAKYALDKEKQRVQYEEEVKLKAAQKKLEEEKKCLQELEDDLRKKEEELQQQRESLQIEGEDVRSKIARRNSLERAWKAMPRNPSHFVTTTIDLINKASPRKADRFKRTNVSPGTSKEQDLTKVVLDTVASEFAQPSSSKTRKKLASSLNAELKKHKLQRQAAKKFNVSRNLLRKAKREKAGRKPLPDATIKLVKDFYEVNSNAIPDKKLVS